MLTKIEDREKRGTNRYALYRCHCGVEKVVRISAVKSGGTMSCGCGQRERMSILGKKCKTHGQTGTFLYNLWMSKIKFNTIWKSFEEFYEWSNEKWEDGLTIYSENGFYDENSIFLKSSEAKNLNREKTCLIRYGTKSVLESELVKQKIVQTNMDKYGVANAAVTDVVKQHTIENNREKYGVDFPQQLEEYREKQKKYAVEKVGFDTEEWARQSGVSRSCFCHRVSKYGFDKAITLGKHQTAIESIIQQILDGLNIQYISHKLIGKYYPDFILPEYNLIIEADGLYWHSDAVNTDYMYHRKKMDEYSKLGYRTLFFRENEIECQSDIVTSIICNSVKQSKKIFARKCDIIELNKDDRREFFNTSHLMGRGSGNCYGLKHDDQIVCALQFTNKNGLVNISRFCSILNTTVVGAYSRLIECVIRRNNIGKIQTFVDRRYGTGECLSKMKFNLVTDRLSFVWVKNDKVFHRLNYRGNSGYEYGMHKLWDCGQAKFERIV
jgi:very-short-patch-repair endonuclease